MQEPPHILILGHGESGKSTLAKIINNVTGLRGSASSMFMAAHVAKELGYSTAEEAWADRRSHRTEWKQAIIDYRKDDPARIARELYAYNEIYEGLRDRTEFEHARDEGLFDLVIYVDRGHWSFGNWVRDIPIDPSMDMGRDDADIIIENTGSEAEFVDKCGIIAEFILTLLKTTE